MREICTSGLKRGAEPRGSAPHRLQSPSFLLCLPNPVCKTSEGQKGVGII